MTIFIHPLHVRLAVRHAADRVAAVSRGLVSYLGRAPARAGRTARGEVRP